jgi:hypothetical protein
LPLYLRRRQRHLFSQAMSSNLVRMFSGRKKESSVWRYFSYDDASDRSSCQVKTKDDKEMNKYLIELRLCNSSPVRDSLAFWHERKCVFPRLSDIALDYLCAPASQAYVERIFSVCGLMTAGRRNRMDKSLEMRVFLQLNSHLVR